MIDSTPGLGIGRDWAEILGGQPREVAFAHVAQLVDQLAEDPAEAEDRCAP